jgi:hypothetical protein
MNFCVSRNILSCITERKRYTPAFKAKVVVDVVKEEKPIGEIASAS